MPNFPQRSHLAPSYSMADGLQVAKLAAHDIETWLWRQAETLNVLNVEDKPDFQRIDVDLIWTTRQGSYQIEVKGDRWHKTSNFFFETYSNLEKGTPGCFMYTQADWIFYYFVSTQVLYKLPMPATRDWFLVTMNRFRERATQTTVEACKYTTVGRLVPITVVMLEVPGVVRKQLLPATVK